jgi:hypothetical protein
VPLLIELIGNRLWWHVIANKLDIASGRACKELTGAARVTAHGTSHAFDSGALRIGGVPVCGRDTQFRAGKAAQIGITTR